MQVMRFATRDQIEAIFRENHGLWGLPLSEEHYRDYWFSLFLTQWGASNLRYMALTEEEDGPLLSSLKLYRFTGRFFGEPVVIAGIGALYTPRDQRTFGSASLLMSEVLDYMQKKKAGLAILFSDIGLPFYERLGFSALPAAETSGVLEARKAPPARRVPGLEIRSVTLEDAKALARYHKALTASAPFAIDRDPLYWEFILYRRRRFWELAPESAGKPISRIATRGRTIVASAFATVSSSGVRLQELGALAGEDGALSALLDEIHGEGLRAGAGTWSGRVSPEVSRLDPRLEGLTRPADSAIPMAAPLGPITTLGDLTLEGGAHLWGLDHI